MKSQHLVRRLSRLERIYCLHAVNEAAPLDLGQAYSDCVMSAYSAYDMLSRAESEKKFFSEQHDPRNVIAELPARYRTLHEVKNQIEATNDGLYRLGPVIAASAHEAALLFSYRLAHSILLVACPEFVDYFEARLPTALSLQECEALGCWDNFMTPGEVRENFAGILQSEFDFPEEGERRKCDYSTNWPKIKEVLLQFSEGFDLHEIVARISREMSLAWKWETELGYSSAQEPLTDAQQQVYDYLAEHPYKTGKQIVNHFVSLGWQMSESTLTRHYIPALKAHGVRNRPGSGYYVNDE